ncbi:MAG: hypothetical protein ACRDIU_07300 [Actinomycetota bacterium]
MSRGGRRRRRRGRGSGRVAETDTGEDQRSPGGPRRKLSRRRRKPGPPRAERRSAIEAMSSKPSKVTTLPPDGTVLEDLIEDLQNEYGVPSTPQEFRLVVRVASGDDPKEAMVETEPPDIEEPLDHGEAQQALTRVENRKRQRRRGRGRRPGGPRRSNGTGGESPSGGPESLSGGPESPSSGGGEP